MRTTDILKAIKLAQAAIPSLRVGQLIVNAWDNKEDPSQFESRFFYMEDEELARLIDDYVRRTLVRSCTSKSEAQRLYHQMKE